MRARMRIAALSETATNRGAIGPGDDVQRSILASPRKSLRPGLIDPSLFVRA
ncbi:MAG: hypothetical protein RQM90_04065 [Methanoculleus sp.]